jgi:parvulin-like peptidyl-prolyl isomerase
LKLIEIITMSWRKRGPRQAALLLAVLWVAFCAVACGSKKPAGKAPSAGGKAAPDEGRIVLRVGAISYPASDFSRYVRETVGGSVQELDAVTLSNLFDRFVDDKILLQAAVEHGVTLSAEEKQAYLMKAEKGTWTEEEKASLLASDSGPAIDKVRVEKYVRGLSRDITVGDDEVRAYYDGHPDEFLLPERVQVSQILVKAESEAVEVWEKARLADEEGFRILARAQSVGPEASEGGEMGVFQKGQLPADIGAAVFGMREGEVSPVVESSYGYHIFRLDKRFAPEQVSLEAAAPSIKQKLLGRKMEAVTARHLEELKKSLDWDIFPENLFFPYQREDL